MNPPKDAPDCVKELHSLRLKIENREDDLKLNAEACIKSKSRLSDLYDIAIKANTAGMPSKYIYRMIQWTNAELNGVLDRCELIQIELEEMFHRRDELKKEAEDSGWVYLPSQGWYQRDGKE